MARYLGAVFSLLMGLLFLTYSYRLGLGGVTNLGPGMWPFLAGIVVVLASVVVLIGAPHEEHEVFTTGNLRNAGFSALGIALYVLLIGWLGFIVSSFLFFVGWLRFINEEGWVTSLAVAALGSLSVYVVFVVLLDVSLPVGVLGYLGL